MPIIVIVIHCHYNEWNLPYCQNLFALLLLAYEKSAYINGFYTEISFYDHGAYNSCWVFLPLRSRKYSEPTNEPVVIEATLLDPLKSINL